MPTIFVAYYRVSTNRQGATGLGLAAQKVAAENYAKQSGSQIHQEYIEVESGKRAGRPQLQAAIAECRKIGATLLIAKLDRLARNVHFISGLLEAGVNFIAEDMPNADRFMLHIYAAMAEEEGRRISERTRAALMTAKCRGIKLGEHAKREEQRNCTRADRFAMQLGPNIARLKMQGQSIRSIANCLNLNKVPTYRKGVWHSNSVQRVWTRYISLTSG